MRAAGLMCESDMDFVHAVLKTLQVVAGHLLDIPNLDEARRGPVWKMRERRRLAVAEIGEYEIETFARRIGLQGHLAGEPCFLGRLLDALAAMVKFPAVIDAADRLILNPAEMQRRTAMRAAIGDDLRHARLRAVDREVLAHDAQRLGTAHRQVAAAADRMPELTHKNAARRSRPRGRDIDVDARFAGALTRRCLLSDYHERAPLEPCLRDYSIVPPGRGLWAPCRETNVVNKQTVRVSERGRRHDRDFCQPLVDRVRLRLRPLGRRWRDPDLHLRRVSQAGNRGSRRHPRRTVGCVGSEHLVRCRVVPGDRLADRSFRHAPRNDPRHFAVRACGREFWLDAGTAAPANLRDLLRGWLHQRRADADSLRRAGAPSTGSTPIRRSSRSMRSPLP